LVCNTGQREEARGGTSTKRGVANTVKPNGPKPQMERKSYNQWGKTPQEKKSSLPTPTKSTSEEQPGDPGGTKGGEQKRTNSHAGENHPKKRGTRREKKFSQDVEEGGRVKTPFTTLGEKQKG